MSKLALDVTNVSKIMNSKGMNVNTGGKNEAFKNFQQRKASEGSSVGKGSANSKSPPAGRGGPRGPMRPSANNQPNKNKPGEAGNNKAEGDDQGVDGKLDLPEDKNQGVIRQNTMANHNLKGEASPTLVLNKKAIAKELSIDAE